MLFKSDLNQARAQSLVLTIEVDGWSSKEKNSTLNIMSSVKSMLDHSYENDTKVTIRKDKKHTGALAISFEAGEYDNRSLYFVFPTEIGVDEDTSEEVWPQLTSPCCLKYQQFYIDAEKQEWNVVNITYQVPTPKKKVVVDPNIGYGHSGETSSSSSSGKKKLLMWIVVAIVGGVIAAVILAAIIITVVRRQRRSSYEEI